MNSNPISDIAEQVKQQKLNNELKQIKADISTLMKARDNMPKLIELEIFQTIGGNTSTKKVSINPEYIIFIEEKNDNAIIHMSNDATLHSVESRDDILKLVGSAKSSAYVK